MVAQFGKITIGGVDYYGIHGKNIWIGGNDPTSSKAFLDQFGNLRLVGYIESGSYIDVLTNFGIVHISPGVDGVEITHAPTNMTARLNTSGLTLFDNQALPATQVGMTSFALCRGNISGNASGFFSKIGGLITAAFGVPIVVYSASASGLTTSQSISLNLPAGLYRVSVVITTSYAAGGTRTGDGTLGVRTTYTDVNGVQYTSCIFLPSFGGPTSAPQFFWDHGMFGQPASVFYTDGSTYGGQFTGAQLVLAVGSAWVNASFGYRIVVERLA
jgi:hypothetical protein